MNIIQVYQKFPSQKDCIDYLEGVRWRGIPLCPYCKSDRCCSSNIGYRHYCLNCRTSFSVTVGTIFHHTHLPLQKWLLALTLILNAKKGISSRQLARDLEVNKSTAWRISMQIREAMGDDNQRSLLQGIVEADETYIGGKLRKGKKNDDGTPNKRGRGTKKIPVVGMVERGGKVVAKAVKKTQLKAKGLNALVRGHVDTKKATLITDEYKGYLGISNFMSHQSVNHQVWYVDGDIHTNTIEGFWALLKRGIVGQFHKVSLKYLPQYLNEFCYRYNHRKTIDLFALTICRALGV